MLFIFITLCDSHVISYAPGRRFPIDSLRRKMFERHAAYFRFLDDDSYKNPSFEFLLSEFKRIGVDTSPSDDIVTLATQLKSLQRTRTLACWHDTSCISNASHFLVLINCVYDEALFYTDEEYAAKTGKFSTFSGKFSTFSKF